MGSLVNNITFNGVKRGILKYYMYVSGLARMGSSDVLLSSFPRSGNTWIRFVIANYISEKHLEGREITFPMLDDIMPELGVSKDFRHWPYDPCPRVIKTHRNYTRLFSRFRVIGVVRDPRDVMVSYYNFLKQRDKPLWQGNFQGFLRSRKFGLATWFEHTSSWLEHWDIMFRYEELRSSPEAKFNELFQWLGLDIKNSTLKKVLERSNFESVRRGEKSAPPDRLRSDSKFIFARDGRTKKWSKHFSPEDLNYLAELRSRYGIFLYD